MNEGPYSNDFSIVAPSALLNGYIEKIIISQIQLQYNVPTIIPGTNDYLPVAVETSTGSGFYNYYFITLPYGFFTPTELAAMVQIQLNTNVYVFGAEDFNVIYTLGSISSPYQNTIGFQFRLDNEGIRFFFPTPAELITQYPSIPPLTIDRILKTYRVFGLTFENEAPGTLQISWASAEFLYTPYIDIYSDALTNYQKLKDTDSSVSRRKGLIARIYLSSVGNPQPSSVTFDANGYTTSTSLGCAPFVATYDLNTPKVINWTPDVAINSLDFQMRDCYGDLLFNVIPVNVGQSAHVWNTEFQMTLLCIESDR